MSSHIMDFQHQGMVSIHFASVRPGIWPFRTLWTSRKLVRGDCTMEISAQYITKRHLRSSFTEMCTKGNLFIISKRRKNIFIIFLSGVFEGQLLEQQPHPKMENLKQQTRLLIGSVRYTLFQYRCLSTFLFLNPSLSRRLYYFRFYIFECGYYSSNYPSNTSDKKL